MRGERCGGIRFKKTDPVILYIRQRRKGPCHVVLVWPRLLGCLNTSEPAVRLTLKSVQRAIHAIHKLYLPIPVTVPSRSESTHAVPESVSWATVLSPTPLQMRREARRTMAASCSRGSACCLPLRAGFCLDLRIAVHQ